MKVKRILSVLSIAAILGTSATAMAKLGCPDNGDWHYGVSKVSWYKDGEKKACWSKYVSWDYCNHSATAKSKHDTKRVVRSDDEYAKAAVKSGGANKAYYNYWD